MPKRYKAYDAAEYLNTPAEIAYYIEAAMEESDDPKFLLAVLGDVVKASQNISEFSRETGVSRETLYKSLSEEGNPRYSSLNSILHTLGLALSVRPMHEAAPATKKIEKAAIA